MTPTRGATGRIVPVIPAGGKGKTDLLDEPRLSQMAEGLGAESDLEDRSS